MPAEGGDKTELAAVEGIVGLCLDQDDQLWVTSRGKIPLRRVAPDGKIENVLSERVMQFPQQIVLDDAKNAYIADNYDQGDLEGPGRRRPGQAGGWGSPRRSGRHCASGDKLLVTDPRRKPSSRSTWMEK